MIPIVSVGSLMYRYAHKSVHAEKTKNTSCESLHIAHTASSRNDLYDGNGKGDSDNGYRFKIKILNTFASNTVSKTNYSPLHCIIL